MKKLLLLLFISTSLLQAQTPYKKMLGNANTDWYIFDVFIPVSQAGKLSSPTAPPPVQRGKYTAAKDTLLLTKTYKKFYHMYMQPAIPLNSHVGYLREDTANRKVYFMDKTTFVEELLYDFSMNVGDSIFMNFPSTTPPFPKGYYKVKAIQNVTIKAGVRKLFKLKLNPGTSDTLRVIESVGSEIHPVFMYNWYFAPGWFTWGTVACKYPYALGVACKYADNIKEFQSCTYQLAQTNSCIFKSDSCNYWNTCSGINELSKVKDFLITPNPASTKINISIDIEDPCVAVFEIYDVSGRKVRTIPTEKLNAGKNFIEFNVTDLESGMYFIRAKSADFELSYPIIIAH